MTSTYITKKYEETQHLGENFAKRIKNGGILALYGELGSGKTTFVQGLAKGLGIKQKIISPTFIIVRKYESGIRNFYHIDLYRIENETDINGLGIEEILDDKSNLVVVEWPEKIENLLPVNTKRINFAYVNGDERKISVEEESAFVE